MLELATLQYFKCLKNNIFLDFFVIIAPLYIIRILFNPFSSLSRHTNGDWPIFPGYTSHVEGWGLYSEFLGLEMGILKDPYQRIGFYSGSLLRAARLVVDTGLHAFGWSRDKAIEYMVDNTGWARPILESQVDRYVIKIISTYIMQF